ncbi:glyoxalase [Pseudomethylobacillus aquaticus]|uniref:Glyoxalase n=1 Tax=Pseudomethylobacillus aquaticus TaxID=2676064 RepID=A0A3N0V732_9PROT|nr:VOC family protein [Pseudomethylobacillus aquaticus]ROH88431.1 glyoxalase [Pseudomethylobacillus aquaticus]
MKIAIDRMLHAGLIIADLQRARDFYEGLLGLTPNPARPDFGFAGVWYDIGANQIHLMVVPDPYKDVTLPAHGGRDHHLAFAVRDVMPIKAALDEAGIAYTMSMSGRAAVFCRDPDGNALEFSQIA